MYIYTASDSLLVNTVEPENNPPPKKKKNKKNTSNNTIFFNKPILNPDVSRSNISDFFPLEVVLYTIW